MFITNLILDASIPLVRSHLASPEQLYVLLNQLTSDKACLYRIEDVPLRKSGFLQPLLLVSQNRPDAANIEIPPGFIASMETLDYNLPVRKGMNYSFLMKANPASRFLFKRIEIEGSLLQKKWLESESFKKGFEILNCEVLYDGYITGKEGGAKYLTVLFEGALKITDSDKFSRTLSLGIGYGRECGLGLLSVQGFGCRNRESGKVGEE